MPWIVWQIASGRSFTLGVALLLLAVVIRAVTKRRITYFAATAAASIAVLLVAISGTALPGYLYLIWAVALVGWLFAAERQVPRWSATAARVVLLGCTIVVVAVELPRELRPSISGSFSHVYVVGDSVSAGIGTRSIQTWPELLWLQHRINIVNLSRARAEIRDALKIVHQSEISDGLIILEIGGNDMLGDAPPPKFASDLDALCGSLSSPTRKLVMFELPLFPLGNGYGRAQRSVADRYHVTLIPRRYFVSVLASPGATLDGVHLSKLGQERMAAMVWNLFGEHIKGQG